ncbi:MAG: radical SAM protein [Victivallaceae bacterium]|nr:radical SAM protein [Victivallaceae bacterium]
MENQIPYFKENFALRREEVGVFCIDKLEEKTWLLEPFQALILSLSNGQNTVQEICSFVADGFHLSPDEAAGKVSALYSQYSEMLEMNSVRKRRVSQIDPFQFIYNAKAENNCINVIAEKGFPTHTGPLVLVLSLTRACNMFCKYCYKGKPRPVEGELSTEQILDVIDQAKDLKVCRAFVTGGEPTLKHDFGKIIRHLISCDIFPYISTNALQVDEKLISELKAAKIKFIQVSFDASRPDVLDDVCGVKGAAEKVVENLRRILKAGIDIRTKAVITRKNADYLEEYVKFCYELGVKYVGFSTFFPGGEGYRNDKDLFIPVSRFESLYELTHKLQEQYKGRMFVEEIVPYREWSLKNRIDLCGGGIQSIGVFADGSISICDLLEDSEELYLGNIKEISLKEAWFSEKLEKLRNFDPDLVSEPCRSCEILKYCRTGCYSFSKVCYGGVFSPDPRCPRAPKLSEDYPVVRSGNTDFALPEKKK